MKIQRMRKQWIPGPLLSREGPGDEANVYPDAAQAVSVSSQSHEWAIKAIQSDRLSSGMRKVVGKAARVEHIVGKTLGMTASLLLQPSLLCNQAEDRRMCAVGGVARAHMKTRST